MARQGPPSPGRAARQLLLRRLWLVVVLGLLLLFGGLDYGQAVRVFNAPADRAARLALLRSRVDQAEQELAAQLTQALSNLDQLPAMSTAETSASASEAAAVSPLDLEISEAEARVLTARLRAILSDSTPAAAAAGISLSALVPHAQVELQQSLIPGSPGGSGAANPGLAQSPAARPPTTGGLGSVAGEINIYGLANPGEGWMLPIRLPGAPNPVPPASRLNPFPERMSVSPNGEALESGYALNQGLAGPQTPNANQFALGVPPFGFMPPAGLNPGVAGGGGGGGGQLPPQQQVRSMMATRQGNGGGSLLRSAHQQSLQPAAFLQTQAQGGPREPELQWLGGGASRPQSGIGSRAGHVQGGYEMPAANPLGEELQTAPRWARPPPAF